MTPLEQELEETKKKGLDTCFIDGHKWELNWDGEWYRALTEEELKIAKARDRRKQERKELREEDPTYQAKKILKIMDRLQKGLKHADIMHEFASGGELEKDMFTSLYNAMTYTKAAVDDTLRIMRRE